MTDEFAAWRRALEGLPMDCGPPGEPSSGYFMRNMPNGREAIAIWRDPERRGLYLVWRTNTFSNPQSCDGIDADEVLASCSYYPIDYAQFCSVAFENNPWPPEYETRLTAREIQSGVRWTPELGRRKVEEVWRRFENPESAYRKLREML